ncbi:ATP-binding protein [Curtanaerobium respiraculi]|uniref:ATP-binding protein n=1 Tax=Curtanaerobium respiraculi TaxID=2949669 RepID=UPI0024B33C1F|nr:ATP-binding protein [Curtanaerobium respiraculi]
MYEREIVKTIAARMQEPRRFLQIVIGARQTGKSTAVQQALGKTSLPYILEEVPTHGESPDWVRAQWQRARNLIAGGEPRALLVLDEIQYVDQWSTVVKSLWDEDARSGIDLRVVLTGSSATLIQDGLDESLAGRFELIHSPHWNFAECRDAFGYTLDQFLYFGGYPGAAALVDDEQRWLSYINNAIIEPTIANDVVGLSSVRNPALMRRLFYVGAPYSAQEVSYRKLLGQLDDRGNTATIAHYLDLLSSAGLMCGLQKYDPKLLRKKASSPRLAVYNTALMTATYGQLRKYLLTEPDLRGRLVESAVGATLLNRAAAEGFEVSWWREGNDEVDFVVSQGLQVTAIEVKSGRVKRTGGLVAFVNRFPRANALVVGSPNVSVEDFLLGNAELFF